MFKQFIRRAGAFLIDSVILRVLIRPERVVSGWGGGLLAILLGAIYFVGCHGRWGRTPGKRMLGLRVATIQGFSPPPFRPPLIRFLPILIIGNLSFAASFLDRQR